MVLLLLSSLTLIFCRMLPPPAYAPIREKVAGVPNRWPELVLISENLSSAKINSWYPPAEPGTILTGEILKHAKIFDDIETILQAENCFCIDWESSSHAFKDVIGKTNDIRAIAHALSNRALQSLSDRRHDDVVADGLLCLKLSERISLDGTFVHSMVGTACEGFGIRAAMPGIEEASSDQLRKAASQLDKMTELFGPVDAEMVRTRIADDFVMINVKSYHWLDLLTVSYIDKASVLDAMRDMLVRRNVLRNLLRTEIAIRLYKSEIDQYPESLESLVPEYINEVPRDGYSGSQTQPLRYKRSDDLESYRLYSVGQDGDDDYGEVIGQHWDEGDLDLKILYQDRLAINAKEVAEYEAEQAKIAQEEKEWEEFEALDDEDL